jgi:GNAT superfamily N-acetyltransferase
MSPPAPVIREARIEDAALIARLANDAAEGMPLHFWKELGEPGEDPMEIGARRVASEDSPISYRKTSIAEVGGRPAGCLITHPMPETPDPIPDDTPKLLRPLIELENEALETQYVYVVSALPEMRGKGVGSALLRFAERNMGRRGMSLVVSNGNIGARRLYERFGYRAVGSRPMLKNGWQNPGTEWVLMIKPPPGI